MRWPQPSTPACHPARGHPLLGSVPAIRRDNVQLQLPLVVAMVSQRYRLRLLPSRSAEVGVAVTLRPRAPLLVRVERVG